MPQVPEGDLVWLAAKRLREALAGRVLTRSDFRVPRFATTDLTGRSVTESLSPGKHLLLRVEGGLTVHTHLRMDGSWRVHPAGDRVLDSHRTRLGRGRGGPQAARRPQAPGRRGPPRPAEPGGRRQRVQVRGPVPARHQPLAPGR